ncbi:MAG: hypothetical protein PHS80_15535, partial [Methanothrix sp.]|nr:hypothetical protein [Methanothrix sp.]
AWGFDSSSSTYSPGFVLACGAVPAADPVSFSLDSQSEYINLSWTKGGEYRTLVRRQQGTAPQDIDEGVLIYNGTASSYQDLASDDTPLTEGVDYCYSIWHVNSVTGAISNNHLEQCNQLYKVGTPTAFTAINPTAYSFDLAWTIGSNTDKVYIRRAQGSAPTSRTEGVAVYDGSALSYTDESGLNGATAYCYSIWGYNNSKAMYSDSYATVCNSTTDPSSQTLLKAINDFKDTGDGDKVASTGYANIPVEYLEVDSSTHYTTNTNLGNTTADSRMLAVRYNGDVLIDAGVTLTPAARKRGMFMYVDGALTVNGTISMTARGAANVAGDRILIMTDGGTSYEIPAVGNSGGNGQTGAGGYGGGGSPAGAAGTSYSGGSGSATNSAAVVNGGAGGLGDGGYYGGGAGNPSGSGAGEGTGGLLIIYAKTVVVSSTGKINSNGSNGGNGTVKHGGGSGGGSLNIFYQNALTNAGLITANGGAGGYGGSSGYWDGGPGGAGTVRSVQTNR